MSICHCWGLSSEYCICLDDSHDFRYTAPGLGNHSTRQWKTRGLRKYRHSSLELLTRRDFSHRFCGNGSPSLAHVTYTPYKTATRSPGNRTGNLTTLYPRLLGSYKFPLCEYLGGLINRHSSSNGNQRCIVPRRGKQPYETALKYAGQRTSFHYRTWLRRRRLKSEWRI